MAYPLISRQTPSQLGKTDELLVDLEDIPSSMPWIKDNPYLLKLHRRPTTSIRECIQSIYSLHSQTVNIWTHLVPALLFVYVFISILISYPATLMQHDVDWIKMPLADKFVLMFSISGIILCLALSTLFHTFNSHIWMGGVLLKADLTGIVFAAYSFTTCLAYFGFYGCFHLFYCVILINTLCGIVCIILLKTVSFQCLDANRLFRGSLYFLYETVLFLPSIINSTVSYCITLDNFTYYYLFWLATVFALLGGVFYVSNFPENTFPGKFDIIGQSHSFMHVFMAIGLYLTYEGTLKVIEFAYKLNSPY